MLDEIKKSINSNLYERTRSPLYGTIIISWCVWNWKFLYYLIAVDSKTPFFERIDCIQSDLTTNWSLFYGPAISTIFILTVFELIANYAYWLHILYKTWRANKKALTEGKQLLTYEQSLKLRNDVRQKEEQYEKLIQEKEETIKELNSIIYQLNNPEKDISKPPVSKTKKQERDIDSAEMIRQDLKEVISNPLLNGHVESLYRAMKFNENVRRDNKVPQNVIDYFEAKELIKNQVNKIYGVFEMTERGKAFFSMYILERDKLLNDDKK